jgi:hypothetical protein
MSAEALGVLFSGDQDVCNIKVAQQLAPTDADIDDVIDNWKTTGFYTIDQMNKIIDLGVAVRVNAGAVLKAGQDQLQIPSQRAILSDAFQTLVSDKRLSEMAFIIGIEDAQRVGIKVIEAQGLKRWVVNTLTASRRAKSDALFVECVRPSTLLGVLGALDRAIKALTGFLKAVVNVVVAVGQAVLKIPDFLGSLFSVLKALPWIVLLLGGYYVATKTVLPPKYDPLKLRERETFRPWRKQ